MNLKQLPLLLIWGQHDSLIPVAHAHETHELLPASRLEVFSESGHFPQLDQPERFIDVLGDFIDSTAPSNLDAEGWRELLKTG